MEKLSKEAMEQLNLLKGMVSDVTSPEFDSITPLGALTLLAENDLDCAEDRKLGDDCKMVSKLHEEINHTGEQMPYRQYLLIDELYGNHQQFEEEKPKKYVVRTKERDKEGDYWYLCKNGFGFYNLTATFKAYRFDTREEAEQWTNPQTEAVEVEE